MRRDFDADLLYIGSRIVKRREELGITASELAIQADMTNTSLSRIESGQQCAKIDSLIKIAKALRVPLSYFQTEELNAYSTLPPEVTALAKGVAALPYEKRTLLISMFTAQLAVVSG